MNLNKNEYNFINAQFENQAILNNGWVINLGGINGGSVTIEVNVEQIGQYDIYLEYLGSNTILKLDINGVFIGAVYTMPNRVQRNTIIRVNLMKGNNRIKFYGEHHKISPDLKKFTLNLVEMSLLKYNLINGSLFDGAKINTSKNMVTGLGGLNRGVAFIEVNVPKSGYYSMNIKFNMGSREFLIDINNINTGNIYMVPDTLEGEYYLEIRLNSGINHLKFYGNNMRIAPGLGEFTLVYTNNLAQVFLPEQSYSVTREILGNGAELNIFKNLIVKLGGPQNGYSIIRVDVAKSGNYNIEVKFENGLKSFKIDVNRMISNSVLMTPEGKFGSFISIINLKAGTNEIKFYGITNEFASNLGDFKLNFIDSIPNNILDKESYDTATGRFENGAHLDIWTNFVTELGGVFDGSTEININVANAGTYELEVNYLSEDPDRVLAIDINKMRSITYNVDATNGWSLADVQSLKTKIELSAANNIIKFHGDSVNKAPMIGTFTLNLAIGTESTITLKQSYTFKDLNSLNYKELVELLKKINYDKIRGLYEFSKDTYQFYNDDNRVKAIIEELGKSCESFFPQDEKGIYTLAEVLISGFFLARSNAQLMKLDDISYRDKCIPVIKLALNNNNFKLGTKTQDKVIFVIAGLIGNASADVEIINRFSSILDDFKNNIVQYSNQRSKTKAINAIIHKIHRFLDRERFRSKDHISSTAYFNNIDSFLDSINSLAEVGINISDNSKCLIDRLFNYIIILSKFRTDQKPIQNTLKNCLNIYPYLSMQYLDIAKKINDNFNGVLYDGTTIDYKDIINQVKLKYIPNVYTFDDGEMIIKTGDKISEDTVKRLYWASKEVRAQFMRIANNDIPLEKGNADDILTCIIYNSPEEYKFNIFLYEYPTNNAGLYIEKIGTFFTYERTLKHTIATLEETFRHEFTHYLQERYLIRGIFGSGVFHKNDSTIVFWFVEGSADFFAGATRTNDIQPRKSIVSYLIKNRIKFTLLQLFDFKDDWEISYYIYGFVFAINMYTNQLNQFLDFIEMFISDDIVRYENYINILKNDPLTNKLYEQTINNLIYNVNDYKTPIASNDYLFNHSDGDIEQIKLNIKEEINIYNISTESKRSDFFETFSLRGSYDNGVSIDKVSDWQSMNKALNAVLINLEQKQWSGYKTTTAYFTNYRLDSNKHCIFDLVFFGILNIF